MLHKFNAVLIALKLTCPGLECHVENIGETKCALVADLFVITLFTMGQETWFTTWALGVEDFKDKVGKLNRSFVSRNSSNKTTLAA